MGAAVETHGAYKTQGSAELGREGGGLTMKSVREEPAAVLQRVSIATLTLLMLFAHKMEFLLTTLGSLKGTSVSKIQVGPVELLDYN